MRDFTEDKDGYFNFYDACPICGREYDNTTTAHHLIPHAKKGKETVDLHSVCHGKIHSVFTNPELKNYYHTIERIMEREEMQKFAKWVAKKAPGFVDSSIMSNKRNPNKRK